METAAPRKEAKIYEAERIEYGEGAVVKVCLKVWGQLTILLWVHLHSSASSEHTSPDTCNARLRYPCLSC